eukprot:8540863-Ditylum_brightwellii.AAC.1
MPNDWTFDEDAAILVTSQKGKGDDVMAARVHWDYSTYVGMIVEKHNKYGQRVKDRDDVIIIDSFDGAEHLKSKKK